jgi:hypothetical protein
MKDGASLSSFQTFLALKKKQLQKPTARIYYYIFIIIIIIITNLFERSNCLFYLNLLYIAKKKQKK